MPSLRPRASPLLLVPLLLCACAPWSCASLSRGAATPEAGPGAGPAPAGSVRFAVVGDFGVDTADEAAVAQMIASWAPDFVITTGDNNYPSGQAATIDQNIGKHYAKFIGSYAGKYGPGSAENRFWPAPGNHDWSGTAGLAPYLDYFTLPGNERYYDVALAGGNVLLVSLDSDKREPDGITAGSVQARWARGVLVASTACLKIVAFHHAAYSSARHGSTEAMQWPFAAWGADLVFTGHEHVYERLEEQGIPMITTGLGGAETYSFAAPLPGSQVRFNGAHGAVLGTLTPGQVAIEFWSVTGVRVDRLVVKKACL